MTDQPPQVPQFGGGQSASGTTHTVEEGETLSSISMKYYDSADRDDWMKIYEANKAVIGDDYNVIRPGMELTIPDKGGADAPGAAT